MRSHAVIIIREPRFDVPLARSFFKYLVDHFAT